MNAEQSLAAALRHHQAGQLAQAEKLYAQVLAVEPANLQALTLSGALAHMAGRHEQAIGLFSRALAIGEQPDLHYNVGLAHWALGARGEAVRHWTRALALSPDFAPAHMNLGNALREEGRLAEAATHLRRALQLQPSPFAHNNLGLVLSALGDREAAAHYRAAIAMHPKFVEPHLNLALDLAREGALPDALALVWRSLQIEETPENKRLAVQLVGALEQVTEDAALRTLVTRAAIERWGRPATLAPAAVTLLKHGGAIGALVMDASLSEAPFDGSAIGIAANEPLLGSLLESAVICDLEMERFLTRMRAGILCLVEGDPGAVTGNVLRFACALAQQCFINEYVYAIGAQELLRATGLMRSLEAALADRVPPAASRIAAVACYFPLHAIAGAERLLDLDLEAPLADLVRQQVREPHEEARWRDRIPRLTSVEDAVSRQVQDQ
ncbi:MAG: tetratricopeptide repeat protein, partial [Alphaproteobacteria bacterium]|nr:tetratricopeptide repeat protein [Alphaproteobacteria bacterium]